MGETSLDLGHCQEGKGYECAYRGRNRELEAVNNTRQWGG